MTTLDTQTKIHQAIIYIESVRVAIPGLREMVKDGHQISEFAVSGLMKSLDHAMEIIDSIE